MMREKAFLISKSPFFKDFQNLKNTFLDPTLSSFFDSMSFFPIMEKDFKSGRVLKGGLSCKDEAAGKVRVFAMVDI
jgi:hypothetical protein